VYGTFAVALDGALVQLGAPGAAEAKDENEPSTIQANNTDNKFKALGAILNLQ
jgi:hypothetical protein